MINLSNSLAERWGAQLLSTYKGTSVKGGARYLLAKLGGGFGQTFVGQALEAQPALVDAGGGVYTLTPGGFIDSINDDSSDINLARVSGSNLYAFTSNNDATVTPAVTVAINSLGTGSLDLTLANKNNQKAVAGFMLSDGATIIPLVSKTDSFVVDIHLDTITGLELGKAMARAQFGVLGDVAADIDDMIVNVPGTDAIFVELCEQKFRVCAVVDSVAKYSAWSTSILHSGQSYHLELAVNFGAHNIQTISCSVAGKGSVGLEVPAGIVNTMTVFGRIGHSAAYTLASGYKMSAKIQSISVLKS